MKIIRDLAGSYSSQVQLVEIEDVAYVLKTAEIEEVVNERAFQEVLASTSLPCLKILEYPVASNQILLEYIPNSPALSTSLTQVSAQNWGKATAAMHRIHSPRPSRLLESRTQESLVWVDFIANEVAEASSRQARKNTDISPKTLSILQESSLALGERNLPNWSLLHADLHSNNVMVRGSELILFDCGSAILYGDPLYDLATVMMEFPGAILENSDTDRVLWQAFLEGYATPIPEDILIRYVFLRALGRYPNPFTPGLGAIIDSIQLRLI